MRLKNALLTAESLSRMLEEFPGGSRHAVVLEDGARVFDLADSKYSVSSGPVRVSAASTAGAGAPFPRLHGREAKQRDGPGAFVWPYLHVVESCGRSRAAFAVLGVNQQETQASVDAALTFAILWLDSCRSSEDHRVLVEGVKLFLPAGTSPLTRERAEEQTLVENSASVFIDLVPRLRSTRGPLGGRHQPLWRLHPERWLESLVVRDLSTVDERLDPSCLYSQVPAFSASDRATLDVLATTRDRRLAVWSLKRTNIHLPLQGLDYWSRVQWHHARGEFQQFGYFPGRELSSEDPLLFLVAPTLHVHPATDTILHYFSPDIDWTLVGIDERWRDGACAIFRKRATMRNLVSWQRALQPDSSQVCAI